MHSLLEVHLCHQTLEENRIWFSFLFAFHGETFKSFHPNPTLFLSSLPSGLSPLGSSHVPGQGQGCGPAWLRQELSTGRGMAPE